MILPKLIKRGLAAAGNAWLPSHARLSRRGDVLLCVSRMQADNAEALRGSCVKEAGAVLRVRLAVTWCLINLLPVVGIGFPAAWANPAQDRLIKMSEVERSEALAVFVESGGHTCRTVAGTFFQGEDAKGNVFWNVACAGGESYVVVIKNDMSGSTRVMNCRRLRAATGADCFKKLE